ncbi:MAG: phosphoglucosamine mutase [Clostridia bacterium]|nr:phosphoglucosamine mutase [Clostridia bacterium]
MGKYFGTDGFRGNANEDLTAIHAFKIGMFLGWYYGHNPKFNLPEGKRARIVMGKDTRRSSYMFEDALSAGLSAAGADVYLLHVTSTPSVAYCARTEDFDCGIMISASHNPYHDNGIKLINEHGEKMPDDVIKDVEAFLDGEYKPEGFEGEKWEVPLAKGADIGRVIDYSQGRNHYMGYLMSLATCSYKETKVGLDCSNGSAWQIAKSVFDALGAKTYVINNNPDGLNVNMGCGSTHIEGLQKFVKENGLDVGFAFDGDADRCLAVDENGEVVNGDEIIYVCAKYMKEKGSLGDTKVVTTIMSNFGLYKALDELGVGYEKTDVGDKYVYENMVANDHLIGGEQSGHIIFRKYATTGDGMITAIKVMQCILEKKQSLGELRKGVKMLPQVLKNVEVTDKETALNHPAVQQSVKDETARLAGSGRVLLRKSGTEPVLRVMAEAMEESEAEKSVDNMIAVMKENGLLIKVREK